MLLVGVFVAIAAYAAWPAGYEVPRPFVTTVATPVITTWNWMYEAYSNYADVATMDCANEERYRNFLMYWRSGWTGILLQRWMPEPKHPSWSCLYWKATWGYPAEPEYSYLLPEWVWICGLCGTVGPVLLLTMCYLWVTCQTRVVIVRNPNRMPDVIQMSKSFSQFCKNTKRVKYQTGAHHILAQERRECESWCFDTLLSFVPRVRDIGGSRKRFVQLGHQKHICCPNYDEADNYRDAKAKPVFENCMKTGKECPLLGKGYGAIISHVDYHMTPDEIADSVDGPTFIINHQFLGTSGVLGVEQIDDNTNIEATWTKTGGLVKMYPEGGTPYGPHRNNVWQSEGCIVGNKRALSYTRIGQYGDTNVYFAYPCSGRYDKKSVSALQQDNVDFEYQYEHPTLRTVVKVYQTFEETVFTYLHNVYSLPSEILNEVALAFASATRGSKFADSVRAYLNGKLKAQGVTKIDSMLVMPYLMHLVDLTCVSNNITPTTEGLVLGWRAWCVRKWINFKSNFQIARMSTQLAMKVAPVGPWNFVSCKLPMFDTFTPQKGVMLGDSKKSEVTTSFRDGAESDLTRTNGAITKGGSHNEEQHDRESSDTSSESCYSSQSELVDDATESIVAEEERWSVHSPDYSPSPSVKSEAIRNQKLARSEETADHANRTSVVIHRSESTDLCCMCKSTDPNYPIWADSLGELTDGNVIRLEPQSCPKHFGNIIGCRVVYTTSPEQCPRGNKRTYINLRKLDSGTKKTRHIDTDCLDALSHIEEITSNHPAGISSDTGIREIQYIVRHIYGMGDNHDTVATGKPLVCLVSRTPIGARPDYLTAVLRGVGTAISVKKGRPVQGGTDGDKSVSRTPTETLSSQVLPEGGADGEEHRPTEYITSQRRVSVDVGSFCGSTGSPPPFRAFSGKRQQSGTTRK